VASATFINPRKKREPLLKIVSFKLQSSWVVIRNMAMEEEANLKKGVLYLNKKI